MKYYKYLVVKENISEQEAKQKTLEELYNINFEDFSLDISNCRPDKHFGCCELYCKDGSIVYLVVGNPTKNPVSLKELLRDKDLEHYNRAGWLLKMAMQALESRNVRLSKT